MKKSVLLYIKKMAVLITVILAGFVFGGSLMAQTVITGVSVGAPSGSATYGTASSVTYPVSFTTSGSGVGSSTLSVNWVAPAGAITAFSQAMPFDPSAVSSPITMTITTIVTTPASSTPFEVVSAVGFHTSGTVNFIVAAKPVNITGLTGDNKQYDGTMVATTTGTAALTAGQVLPGDVANVNLTGTPGYNFASPALGVNKPIIVSGLSLAGTAAGNYTLAQPIGLVADVTQKILTITGLTSVNRVYNGTDAATTTGTAALQGVITADILNVVLDGTARVVIFNSALVGDSKPIIITGYAITGSAIGNYTLTQPTGLTGNITPLALTLTGVTGRNKEYNGLTTALVDGVAVLTGGQVLLGDDVTLLTGVPNYAFLTATAGNAKPIVVASGFSLTGAQSGNYSIAPLAGVTANIAPKPLTVASAVAANKAYDGTLIGTISGTLVGVVGLDAVTFIGTGTFATAPVGIAIAVTSTSTLGGAAAANYTLTQPTGLTANIIPKPITITATGPMRYYGTALIAGVSTSNYMVTGLVGTETVTSVTLRPNAAGLLASAPVATAYTVTPELPITGGSGFVAANYSISFAAFTGTVSPKPITVTPTVGQRKLLGAADPVLTYTISPALVGSDVLTGALARAAGETVAGGPYAITLGTLAGGASYNLILAPATFAISSTSEAIMSAYNFTQLPLYNETITQNAAGITGTVTVPVAFSTNLTALTARYTVSPGAVVRANGYLQTSGLSLNNFNSSVNYVVTSADGTVTKAYTVTVNRNGVLTQKEVLSFSINSIPGAIGVIDVAAKTITVPIPSTYGAAQVNNLVATFSLSPLANAYVNSTYQNSGVSVNNFSAALASPWITYMIQDEAGTTQNYTLRLVNAAARTEKQLLAFSLPGVEGAIDEVGKTVELIVPFAYVLTGKAASFTTSPLSTVQIGGAPQTSGITTSDFDVWPATKTYTIRAENATTQDYSVRITRVGPSVLNLMTSFQINGVVGTINDGAGTIAVTVPYSFNRASLVATFTSSPLSGVKVGAITQVSGVTTNDFTNPVAYTVTSESGLIKTYTVTVTPLAASTQKDFISFSLGTPAAAGAISGTNISVEVPYGSNIADLVATFTVSPLATVRIGAVVQANGVTHNDFTNPVQYNVIAEDGTVKNYTVTVRVFPALVTFSFNDAPNQPVGVINHTLHTIAVQVPYSVNRTALKAYFVVSGGAIVRIGGIVQTSGGLTNDFTNQVVYTLAVAGGSTTTYTVTVTNAPAKTGKSILTYAFNGLPTPVGGVIDETLKTITVNVPYATVVTGMVASHSISELATIKVGAIAQVSGVTANDFTAPVVYTVTAEDGTFVNYTVTVIVAIGSAAKDITYFAFEDFNPDVICNINQTAGTITDTVVNGTNRSAMRAFFTVSPLATVRVLGGGLQQSGLTTNDFRVPVVYQVTAQNGTVKTYTVTIDEGADLTKPIVTNLLVTVSNLAGQFVLLRTNEPTGKVYIISSTVPQATIPNLEAAVNAGYGRAAYVTAANTDIPISTANLAEGVYYSYAIDIATNMSLRGVNQINVLDRIPPTVTVATQTKSNSLSNVVNVKSSDASSLVYLILEGVAQTSKAQLDQAVTDKKGVRGVVSSANVDVPLNVGGLLPGNYRAYAVDVPGYNLSVRSTNVVTITLASPAKLILAYGFNSLTPAAIGQIIGTDISVVVKVGTPITALVASFSISDLATAYVGLIPQVSGVTPNNFTTPVQYKVTAEDGTFFTYTVTVSFNTGIGETEWFNSIKAYPNPVSNRLTIEMTRPADRIQVIDALGQTINDVVKPNSNTVVMETGSWMKGIYFVRYYRDNQYVGVMKVIKD